MDEVTGILSAIERGDEQAAGQLLPLVDDELRQFASQTQRSPTMRRPSPLFPTTARWTLMNLAFSRCWVTNVARVPIKSVW
jgi:hypothetical protein